MLRGKHHFLESRKRRLESSNQVDDSSYINSNIASFIWIDMTHTQDLRVFYFYFYVPEKVG